MPPFTAWRVRAATILLVLVTGCVSSSVVADACNDLRHAVEQRNKAHGEQAELAAEHAVAYATEAIRETVATGPPAEVLNALKAASDWWEVAQWSAVEWSIDDENDFPMVFEHLADAYLALDLATLGTATWTCVLRKPQ